MIHVYTKRCHERDQARIKYVGTVRVREIMRPPTNQSIRRHLSDCSLTLGCPVPPSLPVAHTICLLHYYSPAETPLAYRKRTDAGRPRARDRVFDAYQRARTENVDRPALDLRVFASEIYFEMKVPKCETPVCRQAIWINARLYLKKKKRS